MSSSSTASTIAPDRAHEFVFELFADSMHARRVLSLGNAVVGAIHAAALGVHAIGKGLATAFSLEPKHAIKQVDRLLSNMSLSVWELFRLWVKFLLSQRQEVVVALDWTDFDADGHSVLALNMITSHGRATPVMWKTHQKSKLKQHRNDYEDDLLGYFRDIVPADVRITVLADRGFGDQALYKSLAGANIDFVIRFRGGVHVTGPNGNTQPAADLVPLNGRAKKYEHVRVTQAQTMAPAVVCVHAKDMKEPWCIATSRGDLSASQITTLYSRRFTIEESFRDTKDPRFGGYNRFSEDLDLLVDPSPDNTGRWVRALAKLPDGAAAELAGDDEIFEREGNYAIRINDEITVDVMPAACGHGWQELRRHIVPVQAESIVAKRARAFPPSCIDSAFRPPMTTQIAFFKNAASPCTTRAFGSSFASVESMKNGLAAHSVKISAPRARDCGSPAPTVPRRRRRDNARAPPLGQPLALQRAAHSRRADAGGRKRAPHGAARRLQPRHDPATRSMLTLTARSVPLAVQGSFERRWPHLS